VRLEVPEDESRRTVAEWVRAEQGYFVEDSILEEGAADGG
jgi:hypothetical protein